MSEARLFYNHVVDSLPNQHDRDAIRNYVNKLKQQITDLIEGMDECRTCSIGTYGGCTTRRNKGICSYYKLLREINEEHENN